MSESGAEVEIIWRDAATRARFAALGLVGFEDLLRAENLHVVKHALAWKRVCRGTTGPDGGFFLKILDGVPARQARSHRFGTGGVRSAAAREWRALCHLERAGLRAPRPLAFAEERRGPFGLVRRACVLSAALPEGPSLEELVMGEGAAMSARRAVRLARRLGKLLGSLHRSGMNHRDFYAGHIRIDAADEPWVLDLDRADLRARVPYRWRVKDLAALDFSLPRRLVGRKMRGIFFSAYLRHAPPAPRAALVRAVEAKSAAILRHARRKIARDDPNVHVNE